MLGQQTSLRSRSPSLARQQHEGLPRKYSWEFKGGKSFPAYKEFSLKSAGEMLGWKAKPMVGDLPQPALGSTVLEVLCLQDVWACRVRGQKCNTGWASPGFNFLL